MLSFVQSWSLVRWVKNMTLDVLPLPKAGGRSCGMVCRFQDQGDKTFPNISLGSLAIQVT